MDVTELFPNAAFKWLVKSSLSFTLSTAYSTKFDVILTELLATAPKLDKMHMDHLTTHPSNYDGVIIALEILSDEKLNLAFVITRLLDHGVRIINEANTASEMRDLNIPSSSG